MEGYTRMTDAGEGLSEVDFSFNSGHFSNGYPCHGFHDHTYYEIFFVESGELLHAVIGPDGKITEKCCQEGTLALIGPECVHRHSAMEHASATLINLKFRRELFDQFREFMGNPPLLENCSDCFIETRLTDSRSKELSERLGYITGLPAKDKRYIPESRLLLTQLFARYFVSSGPENPDTPEWLRSLCRQMNKPENFCAGLDRMLLLSGKTQAYLCHTMKQYIGTTPTGFINELRLSHAANLIARSTRPILDICFECGFNNVGWFYEQFTRRFSISPVKYRKSHSSRLLSD